MKTIQIIVTGKVQGVFFRKHCREKASQLSLTGTVRNRDDGSVYIEATGQPEPLEELLSWCRQGPSHATVTGVHSKEVSLQSFEGFHIIH